MLSNAQHNHLVQTFKARMTMFGIKPKSKKYIELQTEFFIGAISILDMGKKESSMSPHVYVCILRGDVIEEI